MSYRETLNSHKAELARHKSERIPVETNEIFGLVDWTQTDTNKSFFGWLISEKLATARDIDAARRRDHAARVLGKYPKTCCEYVGTFVDAHRISISYSGRITVVDPTTEQRQHVIITELARNVRVMSSELALPFQRESINDAVDAWYQDAREARVIAVRNSLTPHAEFDFVDLAERVFDCSEVPAAFVAAVLRKFIYQVLLKLHDRKVGHHLMLVLLGPQGIGKTEFAKLLISPIAELAREADFRMLADDRNIMLWRSYVLFVDEMAYADRSEVDTIKHVISAETLDRRPMRTNDVVTIRQRATLIGASNKAMSELIRDETGMRRFAGLTYRADADWAYLNKLDWLAAWRSVSIEDADPMDEFRDELAALQAESRYMSPVEAWLTQLSPATSTHAQRNDGNLDPKTLYDDYQSHFHAHHDGQRAKSFHGWQQELGRLIKARPDTFQIEKIKTSAGNIWRWTSRLKLVQTGLAA